MDTAPLGAIHAAVHETPDCDPLHVTTVSPNMNKLILRCLARRPEERPANASELFAQLSRLYEADIVP